MFLPSTRACSLAGCPDDGIEVRREFVVRVTHADKPLPGVTVEVTAGDDNKIFTGMTDAAGTVKIKELQPGNYWLRTTCLELVQKQNASTLFLKHQKKRRSR